MFLELKIWALVVYSACLDEKWSLQGSWDVRRRGAGDICCGHMIPSGQACLRCATWESAQAARKGLGLVQYPLPSPGASHY